MDFGKFKYAQSKQMHAARMKQKNVQVKEIKFRPGTDDGDYNIKLRKIIAFLTVGDKVKVTLRFRGREITFQQLGLALLKRVEADLLDYAVVEQFPKMEGRQMVMVLQPHKNPKAKAKATAPSSSSRFADARRVKSLPLASLTSILPRARSRVSPSRRRPARARPWP